MLARRHGAASYWYGLGGFLPEHRGELRKASGGPGGKPARSMASGQLKSMLGATAFDISVDTTTGTPWSVAFEMMWRSRSSYRQ